MMNTIRNKKFFKKNFDPKNQLDKKEFEKEKEEIYNKENNKENQEIKIIQKKEDFINLDIKDINNSNVEIKKELYPRPEILMGNKLFDNIKSIIIIIIISILFC